MKDKNSVIVVNEKNEWLGTIEKLEAHKKGVLHRAFSVFLLTGNNELILQKRAQGKYHSGGLWTNTCCSHPYPGESTIAGAKRRLVEEMGIKCDVSYMFDMRYKSNVGNDLIENEYDHVYKGIYNGDININKEEVEDFMFISIDKLTTWINEEPEVFTEWFKLAVPKFVDQLKD